MTDLLSGLDNPAEVQVGDRVTHFAMPGFPMAVQAVRPCEPGAAPPRDMAHNAYEVLDPEGNPDWVCGWDLERA